MTRATYPTAAKIRRAISSAAAAGMKIGTVEISADGSIRVHSSDAAPRALDSKAEAWFKADDEHQNLPH